MAQDPSKPQDNGKIGMPTVDTAMNKIAPNLKTGGKGSKDDSAALSASDQAKIVKTAQKRFAACISSEAENRRAALDDLKFISGEAQWPADVAAQRNFDQRPCLTINKLPTFVNQVVNDQRQNRPGINVSPVGDKSDVDVAKMYAGLIRAIERHSSADIAYDTAFQNCVSNGFGYWRITTEYEKPTSFDQVIVIKRVRNPFSVYLDPAIQEPDGADAKYGFVTEMIPRAEFEEQYPNATPTPWSQAGIGESMKEWVNEKELRVAEYFEIKTEMRPLVMLSNGHVGFRDKLSGDVLKMIDKGDLEIIKERDAECPKVRWYKLTATEVLDHREWPGKWIPIVKVIGSEIDIEGKVKLSGLIRNSKDSQRMYNYAKTTEIEVTMLAPKAPYIVEEGQIAGNDTVLKNANIKSYPYLQYKGTSIAGRQAPPPQRQPVAAIPAGIVNIENGAANDIMATTGIRFDATPQERLYDESGRALRELRRNGDLGSFHYIDNLMRSLKHCGEILVDLIPKIYDTKRMLTILREDNTEERVQLDPEASAPMAEQRNAKTGRTLKIFNPTYGEYGVTVTTGPSYATKRIEASESMVKFATAFPAAAPLIMDLVAKNQDWPQADVMAARLAKALPPNLLTPEQKDVPPQMQALLQNLQQQLQQLTTERQQMLKALSDQQSDRAQKQDEIDKKFESSLLKVVMDMETKTAATQEKAVANFNTHIGAQIAELGGNVRDLMGALSAAKPAANTDAAGAQAAE